VKFLHCIPAHTPEIFQTWNRTIFRPKVKFQIQLHKLTKSCGQKRMSHSRNNYDDGRFLRSKHVDKLVGDKIHVKVFLNIINICTIHRLLESVKSINYVFLNLGYRQGEYPPDAAASVVNVLRCLDEPRNSKYHQPGQ
jgi:hypothetical protein